MGYTTEFDGEFRLNKPLDDDTFYALEDLDGSYNYWRIFKELLGANGIRTIYGMNINDARPLLMEAAERLGNVEPDKDYWKACDGNAKRAILNLVKLTDMALADYPNDEMFWDGD